MEKIMVVAIEASQHRHSRRLVDIGLGTGYMRKAISASDTFATKAHFLHITKEISGNHSLTQKYPVNNTVSVKA